MLTHAFSIRPYTPYFFRACSGLRWTVNRGTISGRFIRTESSRREEGDCLLLFLGMGRKTIGSNLKKALKNERCSSKTRALSTKVQATALAVTEKQDRAKSL